MDPNTLSTLPVPYRIGLTFLLVTLLGGLAASVTHLVHHHENRDEQPGLSMDDLVGAYHGTHTTAPLVHALERDHPDGLPADAKEQLLSWLAGAGITERYDSLDLGDAAPAEILDRHCLTCHARSATEGEGIGQRLPLEYWDDVRRVAFSREVEPVDTNILVASAHTHGLAMGTVSLLLAVLALGTRWSRRATGWLVALGGLGLCLDLGGWFLAKSTAAAVPVLAAGGSLWMGTAILLALLVLVDLWRPVR